MMSQSKIQTRKADEPVGMIWSTSDDTDGLFECQASLETFHTINIQLHQTNSQFSFIF